jgi:hypothetical protein
MRVNSPIQRHAHFSCLASKAESFFRPFLMVDLSPLFIASGGKLFSFVLLTKRFA